MDPVSGGIGAFLARLAGSGNTGETFINRVADHIGQKSAPKRLVEMAEAEAEVELIRTKSKIAIAKEEVWGAVDIADHEAAARLIHQNKREFKNIEGIVLRALPDVSEHAKPEDIEEDWLANFFDKSRLVSDDEMQVLWAKILAGEANEPGTHSKRLVNLLQEIEKKDAIAFQSLCCFVVHDIEPPDIEVARLLYYRDLKKIYEAHSVYFSTLTSMQSLNLIATAPGFGLVPLSGEITWSYFGYVCEATVPNNRNGFSTGQAQLTDLGQELLRLCDTRPIDGFKEHLTSLWREKRYEITDWSQTAPHT